MHQRAPRYISNTCKLRQRRLTHTEPPRPVRALQVFEPIDGDTRRARGELEQARLLFLVELAHDLPEPLDELVVLLAAPVVRVAFPVVDVDLAQAADQDLELALVKDCQRLLRDDLVDAFPQRRELLFDSPLEPPLDEQVDVFLCARGQAK